MRIRTEKRRKLRSTDVLTGLEAEPAAYDVRDVVRSDVPKILEDYTQERFAEGNKEYHMYFLLELAVLFPEARTFVLERKGEFVAFMENWDPYQDSNHTFIPILFAQIFPEEKKKYWKKIFDSYTELADFSARKFNKPKEQLIYSANVLLLFCVYAGEQSAEWKRSYESLLTHDLNEILQSRNNRNRFGLLARASVFALVYPELKPQLQAAFSGMREHFKQHIAERLYTNIGSVLDMEIVFGESIEGLDEHGQMQHKRGRLEGKLSLPERLTM